MRFKFPIAVCIKVVVFHDVIPWNMLDTYQSFRRTCCLFILVGSSKLLVLSCQLNSVTFRKTIIIRVFHSINTQNLPVFPCTKNFFLLLFLQVWGTGIYKNPYPIGPAYTFTHKNALESCLTILQLLQLNSIFTGQLSGNKNFGRIDWWHFSGLGFIF